MPPRLVKLFVQANSTFQGNAVADTTTTVTPVASRYVAIVDAGMVTTGETNISVASFEDDAGNPATVLPVPGTNVFVNVYVNGVLQQGSLTVLTTTNVRIGAEVLSGVPVVIESVQTTAISTSTINTGSLVIDTTVET
ncbi:DUF4183 domain-containing protein [Ectobacillus antri]|uniref:DUF4183 domain-containing protein n=1 Tax=Ectobacillus antri TaxID=2486280 RepID=A0ABT6H3Q7_9BACI|nr:DUF4183 domain-containing protein [Ectobacillus antri]MDG4656645.1 DUF4183 domain-containing protein [Ectobacillus antri]MDG5753992.1 DUF4183 domain-containing protein [Ectobacillus antri]